ncbi:hypothetical protein I7I48_12097 [Histoplasma ohiense]|nr:hypothetical protein I7I48_12097 [Histoplasma ohiense (nom. inval.)]
MPSKELESIFCVRVRLRVLMLIRTSTGIICTLISIACICHRPLHLESSQQYTRFSQLQELRVTPAYQLKPKPTTAHTNPSERLFSQTKRLYFSLRLLRASNFSAASTGTAALVNREKIISIL